MGLFTDGFKLLKKTSEPLYKTPNRIFKVAKCVTVEDLLNEYIKV